MEKISLPQHPSPESRESQEEFTYHITIEPEETSDTEALITRIKEQILKTESHRALQISITSQGRISFSFAHMEPRIIKLIIDDMYTAMEGDFLIVRDNLARGEEISEIIETIPAKPFPTPSTAEKAT